MGEKEAVTFEVGPFRQVETTGCNIRHLIVDAGNRSDGVRAACAACWTVAMPCRRWPAIRDCDLSTMQPLAHTMVGVLSDKVLVV